jgi:ElaB/YqjD/DUF883 family membrane-anchored ribosome-binding protein
MNKSSISHAATATAESAHEGFNKLREDVHHAGERVADAASSVARTVSNETSRLSEDVSRHVRDGSVSAREAVREAARGTRDLGDIAMRKAAETGERAQNYVRDEPLKGVLVAAAIGVAVTSLVMIATRRR